MKLLYFSQPNCPPCAIAKPIVESVVQATGVEIEYLDVSASAENMDRAMQYRVRVTPTVIVVDDFGVRKAGLTAGLINPITLTRLATA